MCRISGSVNYPKEVVESMLSKQTKGGPDCSKSVTYNNVTLGHNLLSIIGHQEQPIEIGSHGRYLMTFNGCWYDYKSFYPYSTSDTVSLLDHFTGRGLDALEDVNGMFAIGLYDKISHELHLIVDRFGQKPIYYYHDNDKFAFASNPAALYPLLPTKEIDKEALESYWLLGSVMGENSILKGIKKVCAGEIVTFKNNTLIRNRWYNPKFIDDTSDIEDLVFDAIDKVKVSDVPVHIFLSGGVDSTLVASRYQRGNAIHLDSPEYPYAQQVADRYSINLKRIFPEDIDVEECLMDYSLNSGEPTMAGLIPYITAREVSKFGRVAITANGADELFFGYNRMHCLEDGLNGIFRRSLYDFSPLHFKKLGPQFLELNHYVQYDLNKTLDSASMCHRLEVRSPFLDHRLVEMATSIPTETHTKKGNKTILKNMLRKLEFDNAFINRPKSGFSLHKKPQNMEALLQNAWIWCRHNGFLDVDNKNLTKRDYQYLRMSALGFFYWHKATLR